MLLTVAPELCAEWSYERNTPGTIAANSNIGYWWKCAEDYHWKVIVFNHSALGLGCPICIGRKQYRDHYTE